MFEVDLPKRTVIANFRLGLLLRLLQLVSVSAVLYLLTRPDAWYKVHAPLSMGPTDLWFESEGYDAMAAEDRRKPFCTQPASLDYKFSDKYVFTNYTCIELPPQERFWNDGALPFSPLSFQEEVVYFAPAPGKESSRCSELSLPCTWTWRPEGVESCACSTTSRHSVIGAEALHLHLIHGFMLEFVPFVPFSVRERSREYSDHESNQMLTFVQIAGQEGGTGSLRSFRAGMDIKLPLRHIMNATGLSLDTPHKDFPNLLKCGATGASQDSCRTDVENHALTRQTGMSIGVHFQYVNQNMMHALGSDFLADPRVKARLQNHTGPIARITITARPGWERRRSQDCTVQAGVTGLTTVCRYRYNYGIRIILSTESYFGYTNLFLLALTVGVASTYLRLPSLIVGWLAIHGLGTTSALYNMATKDRFCIARGLAGYISRRCSALWVFASIAGSGDAMIPNDVMSKTIRASLKNVVSCEDLEAVVDRTLESYETDEAGNLTLEKFLKAHESNEDLDVHVLARHVNAEHSNRTTCLERTFAPHRNFQAAADVRRRRDSHDTAQDMGDFEAAISWRARRAMSEGLVEAVWVATGYKSPVDSEAERSE